MTAPVGVFVSGQPSLHVQIHWASNPMKGEWVCKVILTQVAPGCAAETFTLYEGPFPITDAALLRHFANLTQLALAEEGK